MAYQFSGIVAVGCTHLILIDFGQSSTLSQAVPTENLQHFDGSSGLGSGDVSWPVLKTEMEPANGLTFDK